MVWNAKWATGNVRGAPPSAVAEELRLSLVERADGSDATLPIVTPYGLDVPVVPGVLLTQGWTAGFQEAITFNIPRYINHTDSGGSWDGQSSIPSWTEATILAAIGASTRLPAPTTSKLFNDWMMQQYDIINLLRWGHRLINTTSTLNQEIKAASDPDLPTATSLYNATPWIPDTSTWGSVITFARVASGFFVQRRRIKPDVNTNTTISKSGQFYYLINESFKGGGQTGVFSNQGEALTQDKFFLHSNASFTSTTNSIVSAQAKFSEISTAPTWGGTADVEGWSSTGATLILKLDGFSFKNY